MERDFPTQYGRSPMYRNPEGTLPGPAPYDIPRPFWQSPSVLFNWATIAQETGPPLPFGVLSTYSWSSPVFDLRPDLRSAQGPPKQGVPIWSTATRLYVQVVRNPANLLMSVMSVNSTDFIAVLSAQVMPTAVEGITAGPNLWRDNTIDVSALFAPSVPAGNSRMAGFSPPGDGLGGGDGYPVRYWRLRLAFSHFVPTVAPVPLPLQAPPTMTLEAVVY